MKEVSIVGLDLAKRVFQVHAAGADGSVVLRRKLSRGQVLRFFTELPSCTVAMEACATAHYWARDAGVAPEIEHWPASGELHFHVGIENAKSTTIHPSCGTGA